MNPTKNQLCTLYVVYIGYGWPSTSQPNHTHTIFCWCCGRPFLVVLWTRQQKSMIRGIVILYSIILFGIRQAYKMKNIRKLEKFCEFMYKSKAGIHKSTNPSLFSIRDIVPHQICIIFHHCRMSTFWIFILFFNFPLTFMLLFIRRTIAVIWQ